MIPLLRPEIPELAAWMPYWSQSRKVCQYSNFGPCFEQAVQRLGDRLKRYVLPVSNGTVALQIALQATLPAGSTVAIPDFTFMATLNAVLAAGMTPVLFPVSPETWALDVDTLWRNSDKFDAFIAVQPFGYRLNFGIFDQLSEEIEKPVIYDCAAGFDFSSHTTNPVCYSLQATKNLPVGEGGLISFASQSYWLRAKRLINFDFDDARMPISALGCNGKLDELHCAILLSQLDREQRILDKIASKSHLLISYQNDLGSIVEPHDLYVGGAPQVCVVRTKHAAALAEYGARSGIQFRRYYFPILSNLDFSGQIQCVGKSPDYFSKCIALPSDLIADEYGVVIEFMKRVAKAPRHKQGEH